MGYSKQAAIGVGWMGALKLFIRGIGFIRLFILARLLLPQDFGLFGIAALVLAFLEIFTETGINVFLIQSEEKGILEKYVDTAWVVSILRGFIMFLIIYVLAAPLSVFFSAPGSKNIIILISFVPLIKGFINPSIVTYRKNLFFKKEFLLRSGLIIFDSTASVIVALVTKSAISLVVGILVSAALEVLFSQVFVSPKPRFKFNIKRFKHVISKGKWVTLNGIWSYISQQGDDAVVAKIMNSASLGFYQVAYKYSLLPGTEVTATIQQVAFPIFSKIADDKKRLRRAYYRSLVLTALLAVPMGLLLFLFSKQIILLTIGEKWLPAVGALKILSIFGMIGSLTGSKNILLYSVKRQDIASNINLVKAFVLVLFIVPLTLQYGIEGAALASLISVLAIVPLVIYSIKKVLYE